MSTMTCPKCQGEMSSYERNGITVDQCRDCRGIFLDRGELDHLVAADSRAQGSVPSAVAPPRGTPDRSHDSRDSHESSGRYREHDRDHDDDDHDRHRSHSSKRKKKQHWVEELFG